MRFVPRREYHEQGSLLFHIGIPLLPALKQAAYRPPPRSSEANYEAEDQIAHSGQLCTKNPMNRARNVAAHSSSQLDFLSAQPRPRWRRLVGIAYYQDSIYHHVSRPPQDLG